MGTRWLACKLHPEGGLFFAALSSRIPPCLLFTYVGGYGRKSTVSQEVLRHHPFNGILVLPISTALSQSLQYISTHTFTFQRRGSDHCVQ